MGLHCYSLCIAVVPRNTHSDGTRPYIETLRDSQVNATMLEASGDWLQVSWTGAYTPSLLGLRRSHGASQCECSHHSPSQVQDDSIRREEP